VWVIGLVLGLIALFVLLLAIPVDVVFYVERDAKFRLGATVRLLFGLVKKDIGSKKRRPEEGEALRKERPKGSIRPLVAALMTRGFPQKLLRLMRDSLRAVRVRELKARVRIGLGDPAETGILFAVLAPTVLFVRSVSSADVEVEPDFEEEKLEGYCRGDIRAIPIRFLRLLIPFFCSRTTLRAFRAMYRARRKR